MIRSVIFDYGGVVSPGSRGRKFATALALDSRERESALSFFASAFVREAAAGASSTDELVESVWRLLDGSRTTDAIRAAFAEACTPDPATLDLVRRLRMHQDTYLISDSLPPYSDYILANLSELFSGIFLSDRLGARKGAGLFALVEQRVPELFSTSLYIDDREENLRYPRARGALTVLYNSRREFVASLTDLGIPF